MQLEITQHAITDALRSASIEVLETMFFAEAVPEEHADAAPSDDVLACTLECSGGETGSFRVAVDRAALRILCESFYGEGGEESDASSTQEQELLCELTNMLAGSTLSRYAPAHSCTLSSPRLCDYAPWPANAVSASPGERCHRLVLALEGGLLLVWCSLRVAA